MLPDVGIYDEQGNLVHDAVLSDAQLAECEWQAKHLPCPACDGPRHKGVCVDAQGRVLPEFAQRAKPA